MGTYPSKIDKIVKKAKDDQTTVESESGNDIVGAAD
jgi:hypothetical protein